MYRLKADIETSARLGRMALLIGRPYDGEEYLVEPDINGCIFPDPVSLKMTTIHSRQPVRSGHTSVTSINHAQSQSFGKLVESDPGC